MKKSLIAIFLLMLSSSAFAEYTFNYVGVGVSKVEYPDIFDDGTGVDLDGNGFDFSLAKELEGNIVIGASYGSVKADYSNSVGDKIELKGNGFSIGVGQWFEVGSVSKFLLFAAVTSVKSEAVIDAPSIPVTGKATDSDVVMSLSGDMIFALNGNLDALAGFNVDENDTTFSAGLSLDLSEKVAVEVGFSGNEDYESLGIDLRHNIEW